MCIDLTPLLCHSVKVDLSTVGMTKQQSQPHLHIQPSHKAGALNMNCIGLGFTSRAITHKRHIEPAFNHFGHGVEPCDGECICTVVVRFIVQVRHIVETIIEHVVEPG